MYITNDRSELILSLIDKSKNVRTVVDLGCNDGATLLGLSSSNALNAINYYGVDYSINSKLINSNKISYNHCNLNGDLGNIRNVLEKSDLILLLDVLEHLYKPEMFLERLHEIIKPESQLIITVPNASSIRMLYAWLKKDFPRNHIGYFDKTHCSWFTTKSLLKITSPNFISTKSNYIYSKKPLIELLQKASPSRLTSQFYLLLTKK